MTGTIYLYASPSTRGPKKTVPTSALTFRLLRAREKLGAVLFLPAKPRRPIVRARAPELAPRRAQATQSAAGTAPDRLEARSATFVVRANAHRARSVPRRRRHFLRHRVKRQFPPVALRSRVSEGRARRVASSGTRRAASASAPWPRSPAYPTSRTASFGSHRPGAARTRHPRRRRLLSRSASFSAGLRDTEEGRPGARAAREPADRRR